MELTTSAITQLTDDDFGYTDVVAAPGDVLYALRSSYAAPPHPVRIDPGGTITVLPCVELPTLPGTLAEVEATAADGTTVRSWLVLPEDPAPAPLLLWIHGGPLGSWNSWAWRWNPWLMAARGYAVLLPDPALSTGYGQEFIQRGWGAWGGPPFDDLMTATDAACAHQRIDATRIAAMGGSFGGYMANWIAGHTNRFAAIVTHASLWALDQFGPTTDHAYYWRREMTPEMTAANSPHHFVADINTPMLVIHGDKDYRVPIGEGLRLWYELLAILGAAGRRRWQQPAPLPVFPVRKSLGRCAAAHQDLVPGGVRLSGRTRAGGERRVAGGARSSVAPVTATREFDIVLYGATGFVGKLTAEYLARAGGNARIALAGRSTDRLQAIRETLGESAQSWEVLTADASSPSTLDAMAARTQVVITTVGPYSRYGLPLVAACAAAGTDYADLTGEPPFVRDSIDLYHKQAQDTGARIVHACGFDSIPSDLTVYALYRRAREDGSGELIDTHFVVRAMSGGLSGGTIASGVEVMSAVSSDADARRQFADPYTLSPDRGAEPELGAQPDLRRRRGRQIAPELTGLWTAGFMMAPTNTRIVRRSNALQDYAYGRRFRYSEHMSLGSSAVAPVTSAVINGVGNTVSALGSRYFRLLPRRLVERVLPKPGTGPSEAVRERASTRRRPTRRRPRGRVTSPPSPSRAIRDTRQPRCCWARAAWRWRWIATLSRSCTVCSPPRRQWATP